MRVEFARLARASMALTNGWQVVLVGTSTRAAGARPVQGRCKRGGAGAARGAGRAQQNSGVCMYTCGAAAPRRAAHL